MNAAFKHSNNDSQTADQQNIQKQSTSKPQRSEVQPAAWQANALTNRLSPFIQSASQTRPPPSSSLGPGAAPVLSSSVRPAASSRTRPAVLPCVPRSVPRSSTRRRSAASVCEDRRQTVDQSWWSMKTTMRAPPITLKVLYKYVCLYQR